MGQNAKEMCPIPWRQLKKHKNYSDITLNIAIDTGLKEAVRWYWNNLKIIKL